MKTCIKNLFRLTVPLLALALLMSATVVSQAATKPPTPTIIKPKNDAKWSNSVYTVTGDFKAPVTNVVCLVNGTPITTSLSNTTWRAEADLTAGTNTISAYGLAASGGSATNKVKLIYLLVSTLTLTTNEVGEGTVSPNYGGKTLIIGDKYKIKATPKAGYGFYFWSIGGLMTNTETLDFTMVTNEAIAVHFRDIEPPTITIDEPKSGSKDSNATVTVSGTAKDNVGVVLVEAGINGDWAEASGTSNWTVTLPVSVGQNELQAYAEDAAGNFSKTNEVKFTGLPPNQTTWSPASITNIDVVSLTPTDPAGPTHYLCYSNINFSYSDTNLDADSGIGEGDYQQVETNYAIAQIEFTAPAAINGITANIDLGFTNFNVGFYTNEASGELGTFTIQSTPDFVSNSWSGKTIVFSSTKLSSKSSTVDIKSSSTFHLVTANGDIDGTYTVVKVSPISAFFELQDSANSADTAAFQMTYKSASAGFYEINYYTDGTLVKTDVGTFKQ
jgi:hypothetical protein